MWKNLAARFAATALLLIVGLAPAVQAAPASAASACNTLGAKVWTGLINSEWGVDGNWLPTGAPTAVDSVCITSSGPVEVVGSAAAAAIETSQLVHVASSGVLALGAEFLASGSGMLSNEGTVTTGVDLATITGTILNAAGAHLSVGSGGLVADGFTTTAGDVSVSDGAFTVGADLTIEDGATLTLATDASTVKIGDGTGDLVVDPNAALQGVGAVIGNIDNFGELTLGPGQSSAGKLQVTGAYTARDGATMAVKVHSTVPETGYGRLEVDGAFNADGIVNASTDGFIPAIGDTFRIIEATSPSGAFDAVTTDLAGAIVLSNQLDTNGLLLTAISNSGSISGSVYEDVNGNGIRNAGDLGIAGRTVFADIDDSNSVSSGDVSAITDVSGNYTLTSVGSGSVKVRIKDDAPGWINTSPTPMIVNVSAGSVLTGKDIGQFHKPNIHGWVFADTNGNGMRDAAESGIASKTVFVDVNNNGVVNSGEATTTTNTSGEYLFSGVIPGTYRVRVVLTGGNVLTSPFSNTVPTSGVDAEVNFGWYLFSSVSGSVFGDENGNGERESSENGLGGRTIFVDKNNNGVFDGTDVKTVTASNGTYSFSGLIGVQRLRVVLVGNEMQRPSLPLVVQLTSGNNRTGVHVGVYLAPVVVAPDTGGRNDPLSEGTGYWLAAADGGVFSYGSARFHGSMGGQPLNAPMVGFDPTPSGDGYHFVAADGGVFSFGDAQFFGSMGGQPLNAPMVGMAGTSTNQGYWTVAADGGVFGYGDALFHGSMGGSCLELPIVGMVATASDNGYWQVAADGGVFSFGDAQFYGSAVAYHGTHRIVGIARSGSGGYWIADADGGVYAFGDAQFHGSMAVQVLKSPIVAIRSTNDGHGYWLFAADGGVFSFGSAQFHGGTPQLNSPIIG